MQLERFDSVLDHDWWPKSLVCILRAYGHVLVVLDTWWKQVPRNGLTDHINELVEEEYGKQFDS